MAMTLYGTGSTLLTVGTPVQISTTTTLGVYVVEVDYTAMANGEVLTLVTNSAAKSGGAVNAADTQSVTGGAAAPTAHLFSSTIPIGSSANWTLLQGNGTARTVPWSIYTMT